MQHIARKRFGQNFLTDRQIIAQLISTISLSPSNTVVEIGPGMGALTRPLLHELNKLTVIELDRDLSASLSSRIMNKLHLEKLSIITQDALKFDFASVTDGLKTLRIVGNLPYNISTPILFHLMSFKPILCDLHFMLQKEVVERMRAQPNSSEYGRLSVMIQYHCKVNSLFDIPPESFKPRPKVMSSFVSLKPYDINPHPAIDETLFAAIVLQAFNQRRKMLSNTLKTYLASSDFEHLSIKPSARAQELSVAEFVNIANYVSTKSTSIV